MFSFDQSAALNADQFWDALIRSCLKPNNEAEMINSAAFLFWGDTAV